MKVTRKETSFGIANLSITTKFKTTTSHQIINVISFHIIYRFMIPFIMFMTLYFSEVFLPPHTFYPTTFKNKNSNLEIFILSVISYKYFTKFHLLLFQNITYNSLTQHYRRLHSLIVLHYVNGACRPDWNIINRRNILQLLLSLQQVFYFYDFEFEKSSLACFIL